ELALQLFSPIRFERAWLSIAQVAHAFRAGVKAPIREQIEPGSRTETVNACLRFSSAFDFPVPLCPCYPPIRYVMLPASLTPRQKDNHYGTLVRFCDCAAVGTRR